MRRFSHELNKKLTLPLMVAAVLTLFFAIQQTVMASPFGQGVFGAQVPFGSQTSISISLGGNVNLNLTPSGSFFSASSSNTVTVTSTDVEGYDLYIYSPSSSSLVNGSSALTASTNTVAGALSINTWGYNTTGSTTNFLGITTSPALLKAATGPYEIGDTTTVTFGALADITIPEGTYTGHVVYTAVAINQ